MNYCDHLRLHATDPLWWVELIATLKSNTSNHLANLCYQFFPSSVAYSLLASGACYGVSTYGLIQKPMTLQSMRMQTKTQQESADHVYACASSSLATIVTSLPATKLVWHIRSKTDGLNVQVYRFRTCGLTNFLYIGPSYNIYRSDLDCYLSLNPNGWLYKTSRRRSVKNIADLIQPVA